MGQSGKKRRVFSVIIALVTGAAFIFTGTYAWQSISQKALNEVAQLMNPGGRLHDDFDGKTKSVYVENFTDPKDGGTAIFARIRLDEYMEMGKDAGKNKDSLERDVAPLVPSASIHDFSTWSTHVPQNGVETCANGFHEYWQWKMGGKTVYMPTFNQNKDSLQADINGTYAGLDGNPDTDDDRYKDFVQYHLHEEKTADVVLDADSNHVDEGNHAVVPDNIIVLENQTHTAKETEESTVLTMAQWKEMGSPLGNYWVYDVDGWAYWANPILPGTATGLLLREIEMVKVPTENWYYAIHVTAQFASAGDWGETDETGFYDVMEGLPPTDDALVLLNKAASLVSHDVDQGGAPHKPDVDTGIRITTDGDKTTVAKGETLQFHAEIVKDNVPAHSQNVTWRVTGGKERGTWIDSHGLLTVDEKEAEDTVLTVTATALWDRKTKAEKEIRITKTTDAL